jgi:Serine/threonine protein kinase
MASYAQGAGMDYNHDGRSNRYTTASPTTYSNNGAMATSPRAAYAQERESQRSSRPMRSHQAMESGEPRYQSSSRMNGSRTSPVPTFTKPRSAHAGYSSQRDLSGNPNVPQDGYSMHNQYHGNQSQAPMTHYGHAQSPNAVVTPTPQSDVTGNTAPYVSSSNSQGTAPRRPAYLLHRDLVIGKGSYGQVCIASRGETEGQPSSSGKRKKFACKCVVLRNDAKYIAKLQEEVNVLRELRGHENVIRLYDVFCVDNELFIITELGRGGDLFHLLTTHPKHGVTEAYAGKNAHYKLFFIKVLACKKYSSLCSLLLFDSSKNCCANAFRSCISPLPSYLP